MLLKFLVPLDLVPSLHVPLTFQFLTFCNHLKSCMIFQINLDLIDPKVYQIEDHDVSIEASVSGEFDMVINFGDNNYFCL